MRRTPSGIRPPPRALLLGSCLLAAVLVGGCGRQTSQVAFDTEPTSTGASGAGGQTSQSGQVPSADQTAGVQVSVLPVGPVGSRPGRAPYAWINGPYVVRTGRSTSIDGSGSYAHAGILVSYAWDFDDDGVVDTTTLSPLVTHRFTRPYSGLVVLRVTDDRGRTATATTHLTVSSDGDEVPAGADNCPHADNPGQEDYDHDGTGDVCDPTPGWPTQDASGVTESTD
jgi:hypothetical protein